MAVGRELQWGVGWVFSAGAGGGAGMVGVRMLPSIRGSGNDEHQKFKITKIYYVFRYLVSMFEPLPGLGHGASPTGHTAGDMRTLLHGGGGRVGQEEGPGRAVRSLRGGPAGCLSDGGNISRPSTWAEAGGLSDGGNRRRRPCQNPHGA